MANSRPAEVALVASLLLSNRTGNLGAIGEAALWTPESYHHRTVTRLLLDKLSLNSEQLYVEQSVPTPTGLHSTQ